MSLRTRLILPFVLSSLALLVGCGSSGPAPVPPPSGGFTNSSLDGAYVFSTTGTDINGDLITIAGEFQANGSGGITGGSLDATDPNLTALISFAPISGSSSYKITADGRGQASLDTSTALGTVVLDFVLTSGSHGLVTEFDGNGSGSGTLDAQTAISQSQLTAYAFSLSGIDSSGNPLSSAGAFSLSGTGITSGVQDFNDLGFVYPNLGLGGTVTLNNDGVTGTIVLGTTFNASVPLTFDFYAIDATHLKLIETDDFPIMSGDAFSQASAAIPAGSLAFTLSGLAPANSNGVPVAAGGFIVSDGNGNITSTSSEDVNNGGTPTSSPVSFSGPYTFAGQRAVLTLTGLFPGGTFAAYPSSGGLLLLEIDGNGLMAGAALAQSSTALAATEGYGFNFTGINLGNGVEVDDIAEFVSGAASASPNMTGLIDENSNAGVVTTGTSFSGTYASPDGNGRGAIVVPSISTLNGGYGINYYAVDGSNFLFIELDNSGQIGVGAFEVQNTPSDSSKVLRQPMIRIQKPSPRGTRKMPAHAVSRVRTS